MHNLFAPTQLFHQHTLPLVHRLQTEAANSLAVKHVEYIRPEGLRLQKEAVTKIRSYPGSGLRLEGLLRVWLRLKSG